MLQSIYKLCLYKTIYFGQQENLVGILCGWDFFKPSADLNPMT